MEATGVPARRHGKPIREGARAVPAVTCVGVAGLGVAFALRHERYLSADRGLGYALGILGLGLMILLLLYPLRKRSATLGEWGSLRLWFQVHMILGVVGPLAILFHANFRMGSHNSSVALVAMLLVSGSGYVGRYIYTRIHRGLFGRRRHLQDLKQEAEASWSSVRPAFERSPALAERLQRFEARALDPGASRTISLARFLLMPLLALREERACLRLLRKASRGVRSRDLIHRKVAISAHVRAVARVSQFSTYERLFSLWHAIHLPLCFILFGAAAVHVVAVHLF